MNQSKFDLLKSHIEAYTRSDGTVVQAHDDKRVAQKKTNFNLPAVPQMPDKTSFSLRVRRVLKGVREKVEMYGGAHIDEYVEDKNGMIHIYGGGEGININTAGQTGQVIMKYLHELRDAGPKEGDTMSDGVRRHVLQNKRWRPY